MKLHQSVQFGLGMYGSLFLICLIGSMLLPLQPYHQKTKLKDLPPSTSYLAYPDELSNKNIKSIVSGLTFSVALLEDGDLTAWGDYPNDFDASLHDVIEIAAGDHHLVVLRKHHEVLLFSDDSSITLPKLPDDEVVEHIFAYGDRVALLTKSKHLFISATTGIDTAYEIKNVQGHIVDVSMNAQQIALLLDQGSVTLVETDHTITTIENVQDVALSDHAGLVLHEDGTLKLLGDVSSDEFRNATQIKEIDASFDHLFAITEDDHLLGVGNNDFDLLSFPIAQADHIYADAYQVYATSAGSLYAWGNSGFLLGSDAYGRDVLTRLFHGGLMTMSIALIAIFTEAIIGTLMGLVAGYLGGMVDHLLMRFAELLSSIPFLPLMITLSAFLKDVLPQHSRIIFVMVLYGIVSSPHLARIIRSQILAERSKDYVVATRLLGANTFHILRYELFPQIAPLLLVHITLSYADSMLLESSLSFLGFGVAPPYPTWGNLLENAQSTYVLEHCWWQWLIPAICIFVCVWSVHLIQEGLRKQLDPKDVKK